MKEGIQMKVKELIKRLKQLDPNAEVQIENPMIDSWSADNIDVIGNEVIIYTTNG
jgi:hypothetical protein